MFSPSKLAIAGVVGTGAIGSGAGIIYATQYKTGKSISDKLKEEGKKLLDTEANDDLWNIKLATYQKQKASFSIIALSPENIQSLKSKCVDNLSKTFNEENTKIYEALKALCTVPTNKEKLLNDGKVLAASAEDWQGRTTAYKNSGNTNLINTKDKTKIGDNEIETWCNAELENEFNKDSTKQNLYVKWCTKEGH